MAIRLSSPACAGMDSIQRTVSELGWDRSTVTQRLKGLCFRALVESKGEQAAAALALAGDPAHARVVGLKLSAYYAHLVRTIASFASATEAIAASHRLLKNLPD